MFIVYENFSDEVIVCTVETEPDCIREFFTEGGRDLEDYDRSIRDDCGIAISPSIRAH